jgi:hypothetical protein
MPDDDPMRRVPIKKKWCPSSLLLVDNYLISTVKIVLEEDNIKTTAVRSLTYNSVLCVKDERHLIVTCRPIKRKRLSDSLPYQFYLKKEGATKW